MARGQPLALPRDISKNKKHDSCCERIASTYLPHMKRRVFLQLGGAAATLPALPAAIPAAATQAAVPETILGGLNAYSWARYEARVHGKLTTAMLERIGFEPNQALHMLQRLAGEGVLQTSGGTGVFSTTQHFKDSFRKKLAVKVEELAEKAAQDLLDADNPNLSSKTSNPSTSIASDGDICDRNVELSPPSVDNPESASDTPPAGSVENCADSKEAI